MKNCSPWEGPHAGPGEECEEEGAAETMCDELTATPFPYATPKGKEVENLGVKSSLRRREGWGKGVFMIWFYFSLPYSDLICDKSS